MVDLFPSSFDQLVDPAGSYRQLNIRICCLKMAPFPADGVKHLIFSGSSKTLLEYAVKISHLLDEAQKAVQDSPIPKGSLSIGSLETTSAVRLPAILAAYHKQYPEVELSLLTGSTEQLVEQVLRYELDGAFVSGPLEHPDLQQERVFEEELVLVAEAAETDFETARRKNVLVFRKGCSYRGKLEEWLLAEGHLPGQKHGIRYVGSHFGRGHGWLGSLSSAQVADH